MVNSPMTFLMLFKLLFLLLCYISLFLLGFYAARVGMTPMPSSKQAIKIILSQIKPDHRPIYELGAGFGSLSIACAKKFPETPVIAIELSPLPYFILWIRKKIGRHENLSLIRKNIFDKDLNYDNAGYILCYLFTKAMQRLHREKFNTLKPGTTLISNTFSLYEKKEDQKFVIPDLLKSVVYVYSF